MRSFLEATHAVAETLGHAWAQRISPEEFVSMHTEVGGDLQALARRVDEVTLERLPPGDMAVFTAPNFEAGRYVHTSGTGRYHIVVEPLEEDGWTMVVRVSRPGGDALRLYASGDKNEVDWLAEEGEAPLLPRHLEAARRFMGGFEAAYDAPQNTAHAEKVLRDFEEPAREQATKEASALLERAIQTMVEAYGWEGAAEALEWHAGQLRLQAAWAQKGLGEPEGRL